MPRTASKSRTEPAAKPFVARRGRPTQEQVKAIERVIMEVARTMFLEQGYAATSMEAVATSAGIAKGTLYSRYPSKPALFEAIVEDRLAVWHAMAGQSAGTSAGDVADHMIRIGVQFLTSMRLPEISAFDRLIQAEAWRFPELGRRFYEQGYARAVDELALVIVGHATAGEQEIANASGVATIFYSTLLGWFRNEAVRHEVLAEECQTMVEGLVQIIIEGRSAW